MTKLYAPPLRAQVVSRPRLLALLDQGLERKLALLSAPAGFGKTTLVADWMYTRAAERDAKVCWLSLDEGDNDPVYFWRYVIAALEPVIGETDSQAIALLHASPPAIIPALTALLNDLSAIPDQTLALVLDDHHQIHNEAVHGSLAYFIEHIPPHVHLYLLTRADPPLPLARMRVRDQLVELRSADLRFSPDEARSFLGETMLLDLSEDALTSLEAVSEGWIAGLQLAALSMRGRDAAGIDAFIADFSGQHHRILEFLTEEILKSEPELVRSFLLETSILNRLNGTLCEAVTGQSNGKAILARLVRENLLTDPLDAAGEWYRYHRLLSEMLRGELHRNAPERIPELHRRAADWLDENGLEHEAMAHSLAAKDYEAAAKRIRRIYRALAQRGELATLCGWLERLPDDMVRSQPYLSLVYVWALSYSGRYDLIEERLQDVETSAALLAEPDRSLVLAEATTLRAVIQSIAGDARGAIANAEKALETVPMSDPALRLIAHHALGNGYRLLGKPAIAEGYLLEARTMARALIGPILQTAVEMRLAQVRTMRGRLHDAAEIFARLAYPDDSAYISMPNMSEAFVRLADIEREWNQRERAFKLVERGIELARQNPNNLALLSGYLTRMHIEVTGDDFIAAAESLQLADEIGRRQNYPYLSERLATQRAWLQTMAGEWDTAVEWAEEYAAQRKGQRTYGSLFDLQELTLARILRSQNRLEEASEVLDQLELEAREAGRGWSVLQTLIQRAVTHAIAHQSEQAFATLRQALHRGHNEGFVRIFVDEGEPMRRLLGEVYLHAHDPQPPGLKDYLTRLLTAFPDPVIPLTRQTGGETTVPKVMLAEQLTERELEILAFIAQGASNQEIANQLFLSVGTVKNHISHILGKLGAQNRTEAVAVARHIGLLET
ncbi:MAG: hypothetical protein J5I90_09975 [Caldilineales bacterium]|nr:hypothetical protein [Caldilineales bacterium]